MVAASLTKPDDLELPFASWLLDRLATYLDEVKGISINRSRIGELLHAKGLRWRIQETWLSWPARMMSSADVEDLCARSHVKWVQR